MVIGIDLHGTLLDKDWFIGKDLEKPLEESLVGLEGKAKLYICTGNDLSFVKSHVPPSVRRYFTGYVLETGCVISEDKEKEKVITTEEERERIKSLRERIEARGLPFDFMGRRLSSISLFTKNPKRLYQAIGDFLKGEKIEGVNFFWSDVAVDIVPSGYNKYTGLKSVSNREKTVGIADSMNDASLLINVDYGFLPKNAPQELLDYIRKRGKKLVNIKDVSSLNQSYVVQANKERTEGVMEILNLIGRLI